MATKRTASAKNKKSMMNHDTMSGFTIIEVVLVLAIAGLIFLMVFIALPQLQRAQRDTQRRSDMSRLSASITNYQANNNGKIPNQDPTIKSDDFIKRYMEGVNGSADNYVDPDGEKYNVNFLSGKGITTGKGYDDTTVTHQIYVYNYATCDGEKVVEANNVRDFAIQYKLEGSGTYCSDSGGNPKSAATK